MLTTPTSLEILGDQRCILRIINLLKTIKERKNRTRNFHPIFPPSQIIVFPLSHRGWPRPKGPLGIRDFPTCLSRFSSAAFILPEATLYLSRVAVHVHKRTNTRVKRTNTWTEAWRWLSRLDAFRAGGCCARGWNVGREVEMHLSGRGTPPSGLYLAERKKPKNLYHLGSKGKEDGEGFLIQGTVTFSAHSTPWETAPLLIPGWSTNFYSIDVSMYRFFDFAISLEEKERFLEKLEITLLFVYFCLETFVSRGEVIGYFDKFDIEMRNNVQSRRRHIKVFVF